MIAAALLLAFQTVGQPASLSELKPFVGGCYRATLIGHVTDTHCFESVFGGAFVRDRHEVRSKGKIVYRGETIYSEEGKDLVFAYYNSLGDVGRGTVTKQGQDLCFQGTISDPHVDQPQGDLVAWRIVSRDYYEVRPIPSTGPKGPQRFFRIKRR